MFAYCCSKIYYNVFSKKELNEENTLSGKYFLEVLMHIIWLRTERIEEKLISHKVRNIFKTYIKCFEWISMNSVHISIQFLSKKSVLFNNKLLFGEFCNKNFIVKKKIDDENFKQSLLHESGRSKLSLYFKEICSTN